MCHVLVIEDEPFVAGMICNLLQDEGATTFDVASTEDEALEMALNRCPAVITADVRLSDGTGPAAVAAIRQELGAVPTIFVTGTPEECSPCDHAVAILGKPFANHLLVAAFARAWSISPFG